MPTLIIIFTILIALVYILTMGWVAYFIFHNAKENGLNPYGWTALGFFMPSLLGLIAYLFYCYRRDSQYQGPPKKTMLFVLYGLGTCIVLCILLVIIGVILRSKGL